MHEVRETNFCRISVHGDERTGRVIVFATIDNLYKGTSSQAVQNLNLMFGLDESVGLHVTLASPLGHAAATTSSEVDGGLPAGFRAAGVACGLKPRGGLDLGAAGLRRAGHRRAPRASPAPACSPRRWC